MPPKFENCSSLGFWKSMKILSYSNFISGYVRKHKAFHHILMKKWWNTTFFNFISEDVGKHIDFRYSLIKNEKTLCFSKFISEHVRTHNVFHCVLMEKYEIKCVPLRFQKLLENTYFIPESVRKHIHLYILLMKHCEHDLFLSTLFQNILET